MLDIEIISHLAKLSRISLNEDEKERFSKDLSSIFSYMEILNELDVSNLPEISQVGGLVNVFEDDIVITSETDPNELLKSSPNPIEMNQIKVNKVL